MVREEHMNILKSRSFHVKRMFDIPGRTSHSVCLDNVNVNEEKREAMDDSNLHLKSQAAKPPPVDVQNLGSGFNNNKPNEKSNAPPRLPKDTPPKPATTPRGKVSGKCQSPFISNIYVCVCISLSVRMCENFKSCVTRILKKY